MKVWLITSGEYSDYSVDMVCSTRKRAERAVVFYPNANIEEWEVDATLPAEPLWHVYVYPNGEDNDKADLCSPSDDVIREAHHDEGSSHWPEWWGVFVMAATEELALKIGRDRIAIARAHEEGVA